jgi:hypothetical protein
VAGYSGTPLPKKLGIVDGVRFATKRAPDGFADVLGPLPPDAEWRRQVRPRLDVVVAFCTRRAELVRDWTRLTAAVAPDGVVWVAWPKRSSGVATDITEDVLRDELLPTGWVDTKVCAIDATWSGLRFSLRRELRRPVTPDGASGGR